MHERKKKKKKKIASQTRTYTFVFVCAFLYSYVRRTRHHLDLMHERKAPPGAKRVKQQNYVALDACIRGSK
jgi:hypothetical protein